MSRVERSRLRDVIVSVYMQTLQHYEEGRPQVNVTMTLFCEKIVCTGLFWGLGMVCVLKKTTSFAMSSMHIFTTNPHCKLDSGSPV